MKFYNKNFLDITFNHSTSLIELSRLKTSNRNNQSYEFIDTSIDYTKFIKIDINLNSIIFIYEEKEPWFNVRIDNDIRLRVDPMFSKINPSSQYENIVYIPKNKNDIKDFLKEEGGYSYVDLDTKKFFAILLKNVKYKYLGLVELNTEIHITLHQSLEKYLTGDVNIILRGNDISYTIRWNITERELSTHLKRKLRIKNLLMEKHNVHENV